MSQQQVTSDFLTELIGIETGSILVSKQFNLTAVSDHVERQCNKIFC